jgi:hypothetical protein
MGHYPNLDIMCLATLREPAIANSLSSVVRDARFAEHHAQRGMNVDEFYAQLLIFRNTTRNMSDANATPSHPRNVRGREVKLFPIYQYKSMLFFCAIKSA